MMQMMTNKAPTIRDAEKALRDVGFGNKSKAILANGYQAAIRDELQPSVSPSTGTVDPEMALLFAQAQKLVTIYEPAESLRA